MLPPQHHFELVVAHLVEEIYLIPMCQRGHMSTQPLDGTFAGQACHEDIQRAKTMKVGETATYGACGESILVSFELVTTGSFEGLSRS